MTTSSSDCTSLGSMWNYKPPWKVELTPCHRCGQEVTAVRSIRFRYITVDEGTYVCRYIPWDCSCLSRWDEETIIERVQTEVMTITYDQGGENYIFSEILEFFSHYTAYIDVTKWGLEEWIAKVKLAFGEEAEIEILDALREITIKGEEA